jgi:hypothetical protein
VTATNVMFLLAAMYFVAVAAFGEGSLYSAIIGALSLIAIAFSVRKDFVISGPWRVATAVFCLVMFAAQIEADAYSPSFFNAYDVSSTLINGIFLTLFVGVVLSALKQILRKPEAEDEEQAEEKRKTKKLTYQV